jgi:nucleotide-binding universal stress UspA family protein
MDKDAYVYKVTFILLKWYKMEKGVKILVPYDGSKEAESALDEAIDIAKAFDGSVTLLHVYWDPSETRVLKAIEATEQIGVRDEPSHRIFHDKEKDLEKAGIKHDFVSIRATNVPDTILKIAKDEDYALIAMGSRGAGRARSWLQGSVSQKVIAEAGCPVLTSGG